MLRPNRLKLRNVSILYLINTLDSNEKKNVQVLTYLTFKSFPPRRFSGQGKAQLKVNCCTCHEFVVTD